MPCHAVGVKGQAASGSNREGESTEAGRRGGAARSSVEGPVMGLERRGCVVRPWPLANWKREEPVDEAKPFKDVMSWQRPNIGSRVTREGHARFWESPGGEIPPGDSTTCEDLLLLLHRRSIFNSGNVADGQHRRSVPRVKRWESGPSGPRASVASWDQERQADWAAAAASHKVKLIRAEF